MENHSYNENAIIVISDSDSDLEGAAQGFAHRHHIYSVSSSASPPPAGVKTPDQVANNSGPVDGDILGAEMVAPRNDAVWNDYMEQDDPFEGIDFFGDVPDIGEQRAMIEDISRRNFAPAQPGQSMNQQVNVKSEPPGTATKNQCMDTIVELFPDICRVYLSELYDTISVDQEQLVTHILDTDSYPKAKDVQKSLKRKRAMDADEEAVKKYTATNREVGPRVFM